MEDASGIVRRVLNRHGLGPEIWSLVRLWDSPEPGGHGTRGNVTVGYQVDGRTRETAMVSLPTVDEAVSLLEDRERLGSLLSLGIGAMPAARRPLVPHWIGENQEARRIRRDMARASGLAHDASEGRMRGNDANPGGDAPF